ncbi:MAG: choice-of-anchor J domain-containing protein [Muribaculaceae bacterium]|nr:choice-of-anchor J domain-containing protein [Muribaculaceae bacterium]
MKSFKSYLSIAAAALIAWGGFSGCQDDFDTPPLIVPEATIQANTTIADLKQKYWSDDNNYYMTIEKNEDGSDVIVHGRVISSDATGNIYKSLVIQDGTGALAFSVNQNSLYNTYRIGQEVVINVTGLGIGKYAGLQQIGGYGEYNGTPQVSFMAFEVFQDVAQLNGLPKSDCVEIVEGEAAPEDLTMYCKEADMGKLPTSAAGQREWQSQLVIFRNVHFQDGGVLNYADADANANRNLLDENGNSIIVRNSSYASFKNDLLPSGNGDVRGILSYYNGTWQILLRSTDDCMFDTKGQIDDPYTLAEAIEAQNSGISGWTTGYIVGSVKAGVSELTSDDQVIWGANAELDNTLVVGETADTKSLANSIVIELPQGSDLRKYGNLIDNASVYQKQIWVRGKFESFMGANGVTGNKGTASEFKIDGVNIGGGNDPVNPGEAVASLYCDFEKYGETIAAMKNDGWNYTEVSGDKKWYLKMFDNNIYATCTAYKGTTGPWDSWLVSPAIDLDKSPKKTLEFITQAAYTSTTSTMEVYVLTSNDPKTATKTQLTVTLPEIPASGYSAWVASNVDLSAFSGVVYIGWRYYGTDKDASSTYCIDNVNIGGASAVTPDDPAGGDDPVDPSGLGSENNPYKISDVMASTADATGVWIEGYVVGWVSGMNWDSGATFDNAPNADYNNTNCILADSSDVTTIAKSIPAGIKAGATRDVLGLKNNPAIYLKRVKVYGDVTKYFGKRGVKNISKVEILD